MRVFGLYRREGDSVDMSMLPFFPQPDRVVLFGGDLLVLNRVMGIVHGFSGFALVYGPLETGENEVLVNVDGPLFVSEGGFFSDDPAALVAMGLNLDLAACRRFVEEGDYEDFVPVSGAKRYGGKVLLRLSPEGLKVEVKGEGEIQVQEADKPEKYRVIPEMIGTLWRVRLMTMPSHKKRRAYTVEKWASGFLSLR